MKQPRLYGNGIALVTRDKKMMGVSISETAQMRKGLK